MEELKFEQVEEVNGGVIPLLIIAAKAAGAGLASGTAAYGLFFAVRNSN